MILLLDQIKYQQSSVCSKNSRKWPKHLATFSIENSGTCRDLVKENIPKKQKKQRRWTGGGRQGGYVLRHKNRGHWCSLLTQRDLFNKSGFCRCRINSAYKKWLDKRAERIFPNECLNCKFYPTNLCVWRTLVDLLRLSEVLWRRKIKILGGWRRVILTDVRHFLTNKNFRHNCFDCLDVSNFSLSTWCW